MCVETARTSRIYCKYMDITEKVGYRLERSGAEVFSIGQSVCGEDILCAHCGSRLGKQIIVTAAIHARECYTALVVLRQISEFARRGRGKGGAYFIPLVNPDGARFFESGYCGGSETLERFSDRCREWKANADGVDLNCNFDAHFGSGAQNVREVAPHGYIGEYPLCAPESRALADFTESVMPSATVSYHCMGGELYWEFFQKGERRRRDKKFADAISKKIGVKRVDGDLDSAGGYKDHCVLNLGIPAVTVELIKRGKHPFAPSDFDEDIERNKDLPGFILDLLYGDK